MKYVQINCRSYDWAHSIVFGKHRELLRAGHESWVSWARGEHEQDEHMVKIATLPEICIDALRTRLDGKPCFHSESITRRLLNRLDQIDPDVVHLHGLLGYYINIEMLFSWLLSHRCNVVWTLHECWAFTGHCIQFNSVGCRQWEGCCGLSAPCPLQDTYPETLRKGMERWNFEQKKRIFTSLPAGRMTLVVPSEWLKRYVDRSFMSKYETVVVPHVADPEVFKPTPSNMRMKLGIDERFVVLGVASKWVERKGLPIFLELAELLDPSKYAVVLVGLRRKQLRAVSGRVIGLPRINDQRELAKIYTAADVLVNPSIEETFGMNVAEAVACGTRAIVMQGSACAEVADNLIEATPDARVIARAIEKLCAEKNAAANVSEPCSVAASAHAVLA